MAILEAALDGANQIRIMYQASLSFTQIKDYLDVLTRSKLLQKEKWQLRFRTTSKGREFLKKYEMMKI